MQWGVLGHARAALLGPPRGFLQLSSTKTVIVPPTFVVLLALEAFWLQCLCILRSLWSKIRPNFDEFANRASVKTENRESAGYAVPAILSQGSGLREIVTKS